MQAARTRHEPARLPVAIEIAAGVHCGRNQWSTSSLNVLVQLAASMRAHGHGGIMLVIPTGDDRWRQSIAQPILYSIAPSFSALADRRQWESATGIDIFSARG